MDEPSRMDLTDSELVARSQRGDVEAFGCIVDRYKSLVCAVALSTSGNVASSEDIAQETFLVAWQRLGELRDETKLGGWLAGVARNLARRSLRAHNREVLRAEPIDAVDQSLPVDEAVQRQDSAALVAALEAIPEQYRDALVLFYVVDHSAKEVGRLLSISEDAVHKRLSRARSQLRKQVEQTIASAAACVVLVGLQEKVAGAIARSGGQPAPAGDGSAIETQTGRVTMTKIVKATALTAGLAACGLGLATWVVASEGNGQVSGAKTAAGEQASATSSASTSRPTLVAGTRPDVVANGDSKPTKTSLSSIVAPSSDYQITVVGEAVVAIRLSGGVSEVSSAGSLGFGDPEAPRAETRMVVGRVKTAEGRPIAGAAIIAGVSPRQFFDSLIGEGGAMSDGAGNFSFSVQAGKQMFVIAMHRGFGWSNIASIDDSKQDAEVKLQVARPGTVKGTVRAAGKQIESQVILTSEFIFDDHPLELLIETDGDGQYEFGMLPAGDYVVAVGQKYAWGGGGAKWLRRKVTVVAGSKELIDFDIAKGALIVAEVVLPAARKDDPPRMVEYWLFPQRRQLRSVVEAEALAKQLGRGNYHNVLFGGRDALNPAQFHDNAPGPVTLCASLKGETGEFQCKNIEIGPDDSLFELSFEM